MQCPLHYLRCYEDIHGKRLDREDYSIGVLAIEIVLGVSEACAEAHIRCIFSVDLLSRAIPFVELVSDIMNQLVVFLEIRERGLFRKLLIELGFCIDALGVDALQRDKPGIVRVHADQILFIFQKVIEIVFRFEDAAENGLHAFLAEILERRPSGKRA